MFKPTAVAIPLLTLFLAACGGSDGDTPVVGSTGGTDTNNETSGDVDSSGGSEDGEVTASPTLGAGQGASFYEGVLSISSEEVLIGGETVIEVSAVDKNAGNALLAANYQFTFTSTCEAAGNAVFSVSRTFGSGSVSTTYRNTNCANGDTITASLYAFNADASSATPLATAQGTITTASPSLGSGSGAAYADNEIGGVVNLVGATQTQLSATIVNPLLANEQVQAANYRVSWATDCNTASFSVGAQNADRDIETTYRNACQGANNLTLTLFDKNNSSVILDTLNVVVTASQGVDARIGNGVAGAFSQGNLGISPGTIASSATAGINLTIVDANNSNAAITNQPYGLEIESNCASQVPALATFNKTEQVVSQGSSVSFSYTAEGCVGADAITVSLYGVENGQINRSSLLGTATGSITVGSPEVGAISFEGVDRSSLAIKGVGSSSLPTQAAVTFKVVDKSQNPIESRVVDFELTNKTGGVELATNSDVTDADGLVTAVINSGSTHALVAVRAEVERVGSEPAIQPTNSQTIAITTGIADQDSFQIAADVLNPNAASFSGSTVTITAFASDQFNNRVPDGTVVNFTAESGQIESNCQISGGSCSVQWKASGDRPGMTNPVLNYVNETRSDWTNSSYRVANNTHFGMTTIMAYMEGEAGFNDGNGNGLYDANESKESLPEPIRNDDWCSGCSRTTAAHEAPDKNAGVNVEFFADYNSDNTHDVAPTLYQGALCSDGAKSLGHCGELAFISSSLRLVQSEGTEAMIIRVYAIDEVATANNIAATAVIKKLFDTTAAVQRVNALVDPDNAHAKYNGTGNLYVLVQDVNGNIPPAGTTLSISGEGFEIGSGSTTVTNSINEIDSTNSPLVMDEYDFGMFHQATYTSDGSEEYITVSVTSNGITREIRLTK
ncbi:MAG: hypothetical protein MK185_11965 [Saccharospirillaceae bacterium]|nr:hypothetical protein [Saccharospirillaceae bacterium]